MSDLRIFVSHSHADNEFCQRLVRDLRSALNDDEAVWMDAFGGLRGGDAWWSKIREELAERPIFIVICSPDALKSKWVEDEINMAWHQRHSDRGKLIIPVIHRDCQLPSDLVTLQAISFVPPRQPRGALQELKRALGIPTRLRSGKSSAISLQITARTSGDTEGALPPLKVIERDVSTGDEPGLQEHREAIELLQRLAQIAPDDEDVWINVGERLHKAHQLQPALLAFGLAIASNPLDAQAWLSQGQVLMDLNRYDEALTAFDHALTISRDDILLWFMKGRTMSTLGRHSEALEAYEQALVLDPSDTFVMAHKAEVLWYLDRFEEALAICDSLINDNLEDSLGMDVKSLAWDIKGNALDEMASEAYDHARRE